MFWYFGTFSGKLGIFSPVLVYCVEENLAILFTFILDEGRGFLSTTAAKHVLKDTTDEFVLKHKKKAFLLTTWDRSYD
jgi:hypothetical protein